MPVAYDLTHAEYEALPGWRWSHVKLIDESPRAVQDAIENPRADTPSLTKLRAIHAAVLEPHRFDGQFVVYDGDRRGNAWKAFKAEHEGVGIITADEHDEIRRTADAVRAHPVARDLLAEGASEVSVTWDDAETGLPCKGRIDWLGPGGIVDLKTCGTVNERGVASMVARYLWHGQLAHYSAGLVANGFDRLPAFIIAAEGKGAQDVAVFQLDRGIPDGALHIGEGLRAGLMRRLAECARLDFWPGRHPDCVPLCLPSYALGEPEIDAGDIAV